MAGMKFGYSDNTSGNCYCDECGAYGRARKENPPEGNKNKKEANSIIPISEILGRISQLKNCPRMILKYVISISTRMFSGINIDLLSGFRLKRESTKYEIVLSSLSAGRIETAQKQQVSVKHRHKPTAPNRAI